VPNSRRWPRGRLFDERKKLPPRFDLLSMLAHGESTKDMPLNEFIGNLGLPIVGGNDTTRNSMTGGLIALNQFPDEYRKLMANPDLAESAVSEIIRFVTPVIHMRRTAVRDAELAGQRIKAGDKVVMWCISANRDEDAIGDPNRLIIDRSMPRQHVSFGFGIHRRVGNWLAELQLKILWEEILHRFPMIEVVGEPKRVYSNFINGFSAMPVGIPALPYQAFRQLPTRFTVKCNPHWPSVTSPCSIVPSWVPVSCTPGSEPDSVPLLSTDTWMNWFSQR
jgi:cytochrome P450